MLTLLTELEGFLNGLYNLLAEVMEMKIDGYY